MSDLVTWLLAQLDADEAAARAATPGPWRLTDLPGANEVWADRDAAGHDAFMVATTSTRLNPDPGVRGLSDAAHIAHHDPARVLAEVAAKRAIVASLVDAEAVIASIGPDLDKPGDHAEWFNYHAWREAVERLASVYEGAPGWQEEWR